MITEVQLTELVKKVKAETKQRKFTQAIELIINFKDIDVKKGFALNELVQLPKTNSPATVCVMATGEMSQKAKQANADAVIGTDELDKLDLYRFFVILQRFQYFECHLFFQFFQLPQYEALQGSGHKLESVCQIYQ